MLVTFYHTDGLGSIVAMTDDQARNVQQYEYDSFGNQHDMKNRIKQPYGYTGREHDRETGLRYYRARYYDGEVGVFLCKDPIGFLSGDTNLYNYVSRDPINYIDPTGLYGVGGSAGGAFNFFGIRSSFHMDLRLVHDSNKSYFDLSAYSVQLTNTLGDENAYLRSDCEKARLKEKGIEPFVAFGELDVGLDLLFTNADHVDQLSGDGLASGFSGGWWQAGYDYEITHALDKKGNLTGIWEQAFAIPRLGANFGFEMHVDSHVTTLPGIKD